MVIMYYAVQNSTKYLYLFEINKQYIIHNLYQ